MPTVSLVATLVATLLGFALGGLWYGPLFGRAWRAQVGLTPAEIERVNPLRAFGGTFVLGLVSAYVFGLYVGPNPGRAFAIATGAAAGLCFVAPSLATNHLFEGKSTTLMLINGGYHAVRFALIGAAFALLG
jgi:hypothetical protein